MIPKNIEKVNLSIQFVMEKKGSKNQETFRLCCSPYHHKKEKCYDKTLQNAKSRALGSAFVLCIAIMR